jgi:phospholipase A-2-activating protein
MNTPQQEKFAQDAVNSTISAKQLGDINKEDIPYESVLARPGNREGQTRLVKQADGKIACYQWTAADGWQCVGEVCEYPALPIAVRNELSTGESDFFPSMA